MNLSKYKHVVFSLATGGVLVAGLFFLLNGTTQIARADPDQVFAKPGGTGTDCTQAQPCALQTALAQASDDDTIYIAQGDYTGAGGAVITLTKSIILYGGWDGAASGPVARDPDAHPTTMNGEGARRGVYISGDITVTLEGFTVTNGVVVGNGGGLHAHNAHLTLRGMTFYSNVITATARAYGGGAFVEGGALHVEASTFQVNSAWAPTSAYGGGLAISATLTATVEGSLFQDNDAWHAGGLYFLGSTGGHSPFTLRNSTFVDNGLGHTGSAYGGYAGAIEVKNAKARIEGNTFSGSRAANDYGALGIFSSDLLLARNVISGNKCARTAGLYLFYVSPFTVTNNLIAENQSTYTGRQYPAVQVRGGDGQFLHNTIARNASTFGVQVDSGGTVALTNTILVSHTVGITVTSGSTATLEATLWGSGVWGNGTDWGGDGAIVTGTVNIWGDPAFVDPDGGDYHIGSGSAAVDAGVDAGVTTDIEGMPRDATPDIGAYERGEYRIFLPLTLRNVGS